MRLPLLLIALFVQLACSSLRPTEPRGYAERAREFAVLAGLKPIKEGEVRVWSDQVVSCSGVSLAGNELIEYRFCYVVPSKYKLHNRAQWFRSRLTAEKVLEVRSAVDAVVDLYGQPLECGRDILDGGTTLIEALVNGVHVFVGAENPDEKTSEACGRIAKLESLLWKAMPDVRDRGSRVN
ncbi:MAG: hypothetical protein ABI645_04665 [Pseudomonadota bacterium]